jgi:hypothetical protein
MQFEVSFTVVALAESWKFYYWPKGIACILERFKKYCSCLERGFLGFGEALAKEHARSGL